VWVHDHLFRIPAVTEAPAVTETDEPCGRCGTWRRFHGGGEFQGPESRDHSWVPAVTETPDTVWKPDELERFASAATEPAPFRGRTYDWLTPQEAYKLGWGEAMAWVLSRLNVDAAP
jgi:hypothetical protein